MTEKLINKPLEEFEAFKATIRGKQHDMLYDKASDLVVILNYAPGRNLIYQGHKMNALMKLSREEFENHPDARMVLASHDELSDNTPAELFHIDTEQEENK